MAKKARGAASTKVHAVDLVFVRFTSARMLSVFHDLRNQVKPPTRGCEGNTINIVCISDFAAFPWCEGFALAV